MYDRDVIIPLFDSDLQPFLSKFCMSVHPNLILPMCDGCSRKLFLSMSSRAVAPFFADSILSLSPSRKCRLQRLEIGKQQIMDAARLRSVGRLGEKAK